uniref:Uncharacterized protein n=1 Tax=Octopus bimaculoides TaxID=37653 RepID=A0A0L8FX36_OCTBM
MSTEDERNKITLLWVSKGRRKDYVVIASVGNKEFLSSCKRHCITGKTYGAAQQ